jgi:hypothetical protein
VSRYLQMQSEPRRHAPDDDEQPAEQAAEARLTRKPVAERLGVSVFKVRSLEGKALHPEVVNGVHYFDPAEVERVARELSGRARRSSPETRSEGEIAALVFRAFEEDKDLHAIVTELAVPPETVRVLYRQWREPDLEAAEVARQRRERAEAARRAEAEEQRRHDEQMERWEKTMQRLGK